jgi:NADH-quinone oxidoreductase subunit E
MEIPVQEINEIIEEEIAGEGSLIGALESIQRRLHYLPAEALVLVSEHLQIPLSQAYAVATFYNTFSLEPKGRHTIQVCMGTACHVRGSPQILERLEFDLGIKPGETTEDNAFTLETVNCLGTCALGPVILVDDEYFGQMNAQKAASLIKKIKKSDVEVDHNEN